ncbi:hypothetical protein [Marinobacter nauticus]|uniref:Uncharacterized protein n=1 Tax=Marinobacter nauticus TaxID=2743 RepID=A0A1M2V0W7_MARNT|nr:hypothetical protein [Marinobacter nauticus]OJT01227.1 hypothetical protein BEE62_14860 [Marinobacter nauticus]
MELDFDALGIELDDEQKQKILDAAKKAHDDDVAGLRAKRDELLDGQRRLKDQIKQFEGIDPERVRNLEKMLAENEEAKLIADGKIDELINKRLSREQATWQSQLEQKDTETQQLRQQIEALQGATINSGIASAAAKAGLAPTAIEDAQLIARHSGWGLEDGVPVLRNGEEVVRGKNGPITFEEWLESQRDIRPHWFPTPKGGGAPGNRGGKAVTKKFNEMNGAELKQLRQENPAEYERLRDEYHNRQ